MKPETIVSLSNAVNALVDKDPNPHMQNEPNMCHCSVSSAQNPHLQNEPNPQLEIGNWKLELLLKSFLKDLAPKNAIELHLATRLAEIAHRQNRLSACEFQVLQNEANRQYENKLIQWRQEKDDHYAKYGAYNKDHPLPEKPAQDEQTHLTLLAHAFTPTLQPKDTPASKKPPILSPYERYLKTQLTLDTHFLRLLTTYKKLQNKPTPSETMKQASQSWKRDMLMKAFSNERRLVCFTSVWMFTNRGRL